MSRVLLDDEEFRLRKGRKGEKVSAVKERLLKPAYLAKTKVKSPQAVIKVAAHGRGGSGKRMMMYIARADRNTEKVQELEDENGTCLSTKSEIAERYKDWSQQFEKERYGKGKQIREYEKWIRNNPDKTDKDYPGQKPRMKRHVSHMILSADCAHSASNMRKVMQAARELMQEEYGQKGYQYVMTAHNDGKRPHVHVVLSAYNKDKDKPKVRIGPNELFKMRSIFADRLQDMGIEQTATRRIDRIETLQKIVGGLERLKENEKYSQRTIRNQNPDKNMAKTKLIQEQAISRIRQQIKSNTNILSKKRIELMQQLQANMKTIKSAQPLSANEIKGTVLALGKDAEKFKDQIDQLKNPGFIETKAIKRKERAQIRLVNYLSKKINTEIDKTRQEIPKSNLTSEERKAVLKHLRDYQNQVNKVMSKSRMLDKNSGLER